VIPLSIHLKYAKFIVPSSSTGAAAGQPRTLEPGRLDRVSSFPIPQFPPTALTMTTLNLENLPSEDDKNLIPFPSRRSVIHATKGIISSTQPLANEAGYRILAKQGNAADAAVAVAAALNVTGTYPDHTNPRTNQHRSEPTPRSR
jgi:Gamma-glutamyltranspeptidase